MMEFRPQHNILIEGSPFKKVIALKHITDRFMPIIYFRRMIKQPDRTGLRLEKAAGKGKQGRFSDGCAGETDGKGREGSKICLDVTTGF